MTKLGLKHIETHFWKYLENSSCVLDGLTTTNKFSVPRIIRYSMPKNEKQIY